MKTPLLHSSKKDENIISKIQFKKAVSSIIAFIAVASLLWGNDSKSQTLPTGFSQVLVAGGISNPTVMAFSPDGRIFL